MSLLFYTMPSIAELIVTQPLDVLKTRMQSGLPFSWRRHTFRGFPMRSLGFLPIRSTFWWAQHNSPYSNRELFKKTLFVTTTQSIFDIPIDYVKTRMMNQIHTPHRLSQLIPIATFHYLRNFLFCGSLIGTRYIQQKYNTFSPAYYDLLSFTLGSSIGTIISQPFDVLKTRYTSNQNSFILSWRGLIPRLLITSSGLTVGALTLSMMKHLQGKQE